MRALLLSLLVVVQTAFGGLERFAEFIPPDAGLARSIPQEGVRITYLGTNGYLLESTDAAILIDPYFSRMSLFRSSLGLRTVGRPDLVAKWLRTVPLLDAVLVTHGHVDHLYDVPQILKTTGARLLASPTSGYLVQATGVPRERCTPLRGGEAPIRIRGATIRAFPASHDTVLGFIPFEGHLNRPPKRAPASVADWKCGEPLAFLIEIGRKRIFVNSGSAREGHPPRGLGQIDLAILGVATGDSRHAFPRAVRILKPKRVLPSHQDNFFRPLDRGFSFLPLSDFPHVVQSLGPDRRRIILLPYFKPWMIP